MDRIDTLRRAAFCLERSETGAAQWAAYWRAEAQRLAALSGVGIIQLPKH